VVVVRTRNTPDIWVPQLSAKERRTLALERDQRLREEGLAEVYATICRSTRRKPRRERDSRIDQIMKAADAAMRRDLALIKIRSGPLGRSDDDDDDVA